MVHRMLTSPPSSSEDAAAKPHTNAPPTVGFSMDPRIATHPMWAVCRARYRGRMAATVPFGTLDYVYMPSHDVAADLRYFTETLGGQAIFAIDDGGTKVAMVTLGTEPPRLLLTDHLDTDAPILVFKVDDLSAQVARLHRHKVDGWRLELPMGPAFSWTAPGGQRVAIYESTRPFVVAGFEGRRDF